MLAAADTLYLIPFPMVRSGFEPRFMNWVTETLTMSTTKVKYVNLHAVKPALKAL